MPTIDTVYMRTLTIAAAKGGTGKTTTATTLAAVLAGQGWRVALRDLDPQASATLALGREPSAHGWHMEAEPIELGDGHTFDLYPGGRALPTERVPSGDVVPRQREYDVLLLDTMPALVPLTLRALGAADLVLVPLSPSPLDLPALDVLPLLQDMQGGPPFRLLLTKVHGRRSLTGDVGAMLEEKHPGALLRTAIPEDVRAAEAPGYGVPVTEYAPSSRAAEAYRALGIEVAAALGLRRRAAR